jgi:Fe-S cluster biogenesis protein NfuA/nitrite reductase/ring-hydroxylating ferredoxin subunit
VEFDAAVAELEALVQRLEREGDEGSLRLLELIDAIHRPALEQIVAGRLEHPLARALLAMYELAPVDEHTLVEEALDEVRPYIHSHGGEVELLEVTDGVVRVRMSGSCSGCAASAMTLRRGIEYALRARYPAFKEVVAEEKHDPISGMPLPMANARRPVFASAGTAGEIAPGRLRRITVDGVAVLLANVEGEIFAFRNNCAVDGMPLEGGRLADSVIVCPWHNCAYDSRTGKRIDEPDEPGLAVVPIAVERGVVQVAVNVA